MNTFKNNCILFKFNNKHKLDTPSPPRKHPPVVCFGSYCMKAVVNKYDKDNELRRIYKGYSEDVDIVDDVANACERRRRDNEVCGPPRLVFLKEMPNCNGLITEHDEYDLLVSIVRKSHT